MLGTTPYIVPLSVKAMYQVLDCGIVAEGALTSLKDEFESITQILLEMELGNN